MRETLIKSDLSNFCLFPSKLPSPLAMEEDFEVVKKEWHKQDLIALTSQMKEHESLLRLKRRWLIDLPLSKAEGKRLGELLPPNDKTLPESLLREYDASYEDIRACVEKAFGADNHVMEYQCVQEGVQIVKSRDDIKDVIFLLDGMTNKGLHSLTKILTGGMTQFVKTNLSMKRTIKEHLLEASSDKNRISKLNTNQLFQLLKDPNNFRGSSMMLSTPSESYMAAAIKVLDSLEDFSSRTLNAMHRKLRGIRGSIPTIQCPMFKRAREDLIRSIRKKCKKMLSDLRKVGKPSEPLASALGVAGLDLKLLLNRPAAIDFRKFSPDVEALQNDIAKAISLLKYPKIVTVEELEKLQLLLDPTVAWSKRELRTGMRNVLTEYLFECGDIDKVPDCLVETLSIINRKFSSSESYSSSQESIQEEIQREVEHVSTLSAQGKGVLIDWLPEHEFDEDFKQAYIEDFEKSDTRYPYDGDEEELSGDISKHCEFHTHNSYGQTESIGETKPAESISPVSTSDLGCFSERLNSPSCIETNIKNGRSTRRNLNPSGCIAKPEPARSDPLDVTKKQNLSSVSYSFNKKADQDDCKSEETIGCSSATPTFKFSDDLPVETNLASQQSRPANLYVEIQEACDATSMVAYRFVGHMLNELAKIVDIELYQGDHSYLRNGASSPDDSEGSPDTMLTSKFSAMWKNVLGL